jgi:hypothetical protein
VPRPAEAARESRGRSATLAAFPSALATPADRIKEIDTVNTLRLAMLLLSLAALVMAGCSKSSTSQASSESSSGSSASSSGSSSPSSGPSGYEKDIRDYTTQWLLSGGDIDAFETRIGEMARKKGITDWHADQKTLQGIGRGLKKAGVSGERYTELETKIVGSDAQALDWIRKGYKAEPKPD